MRFQKNNPLLLAVLAAAVAAAPLAAQEFVCIPTCDSTDSRLLAMTPEGALSSLSPAKLDITIAIAGDRGEFRIGIFDGDAGVGTGFWDLGQAEVVYSLFADPDKDGVLPGETPIAVFNSIDLPDNAWSDSGPLPTGEEARAASGNFFYSLKVELTQSFTGNQAISTFKVRSSGPATIEIFQQPFAFIANVTGLADGTIVYPNFPVLTPTTYDGTFSFFFGAETSLAELNVWDGDLDFGDGVTALDDDDPNTPSGEPGGLLAVPFAGHAALGIDPFATAAAFVEGIACDNPDGLGPFPTNPGCRTGIGNPKEDRFGATLVRSPAVTYTVISPDGRSWHNPNPSGNREWERFRVEVGPGCVAGVTADYCETELLPPGAYEVRVRGLDMQNLNFFYFNLPLRCVDPDGSACEELRPYRIGDTVWEDLDADGNGDPAEIAADGELGIPGVVVELVDRRGVVVARTVTDAAGRYFFDVEAGEWTVRIADVNFATLPADALLGDRVWLDLDSDGLQDAGEPGIPNIRVLLIGAGLDGTVGGGDDMLLASTLTDSLGDYLFSSLPAGSYYTRVHTASLPASLAPSGDPDEGGSCVVCDHRSEAVSLAAGDSDLTLDFGYTPAAGTAVVGDFVWLDADADGILDSGEPGIGAVTLDLIDLGADGAPGGGDDMVVATVTTSGGHYLFTGVAPGDYVIDVTDTAGALAGYSLTVGPESNPDPTAPFTVVVGDAVLTKDFGYDTADPLFQICDVTWLDSDRDGLFGAGESPIGGVTVALVDSAGGVAATAVSSAADGRFCFDDLPPGRYTLRIIDTAGALSGLLPTTLPAVVARLQVEIIDADVSGIRFGYAAGGLLRGAAATTASPTQVDTVVDANVLTYDFGYRFGSVGDRVWVDLDGDGQQDPGEPGINGVRVWIDLDGDGIFTVGVDRETVTAGDGIYGFDRVGGGSYTVFVDPTTLPAGLDPTFDLDGVVSPNAAMFLLGAGEDRSDVDFGYGESCGLVVEKSCQVVPQPGSFDCGDAKPLDVLSMIWSGGETVRIKAWKGNVGSTLLATIDGVTLGQEVSVGGYAGSPNDVTWELFAPSGVKLGESEFHLSCSDAEMNGPEDCGKLQGDGKSDDSDLINLWMLEGLAGNGQTLDCTPTPPGPAELCEAEMAPPAGCDSLGDPSSLTFRYTGGSCADSDNDQGSKASCSGSVDGAALATVTSNSSKLVIVPTVVAPGDDFTVSGDFGSDFELRLTNSSTQTNKIHTSCSAPLVVGDVFGALTLEAFNGQLGGFLVNYQYAVSNGGAPLSGVTLVDDQLGLVAGPLDLAFGSQATFAVEARLTETTVNHVDATGQAPFGTICGAADEATVVLTEPCFECDGGVTDLVFVYLGGAAAEVVIYDDKDPKANEILFQGPVGPGDQIAITKRPGKDKFDSNISLWVDGVESGELHTSCSQPIGPGQRVGEFEIVEARSRNNGLICPLDTCDARDSGVEIKDHELKWEITNAGDLPLVIERISISWPPANGALEEIKRDGDVIHKGDFDPPSAVIDSGWEGDRDKRRIKEGETDTLKFKFDHDASPTGPYEVTVEFDQGCALTLEFDAPGGGGTFECSKPIDALTMIWDGSQAVRVKAWKGGVGSTLLADAPSVTVGTELTVSGFAGSPNDVIWELFAAGTSTKLGESKFHLSCSDDEMDGPEDCGKRQGDGKGNDSALVNDWLLEGIVDSDEILDCTP